MRKTLTDVLAWLMWCAIVLIPFFMYIWGYGI